MSQVPNRPDQRPRLRRSRRSRIVAGVCGGIGEYLGVDVTLIRIAFVVLALAGGGGVILYVLGWIAIPEADAEEPGSTPRAGSAGASPGDSARLIFGGLLLVVGTILLLNLAVPWFGRLFWPLALIAVGVAIIVQSSASRR